MGAKERIDGENYNVLDLTLTSAVTAWTPVFVAGLGALIPKVTADANVKVAYIRSGRYQFPITTSLTVSRGRAVYYNSAANTVQETIPAAGFYLGVAADNGTGTAGYVDVLINETVGNSVQPKVTVTDIADTAPTLTAAQIIGGIIKSTPTAARAATLPTAALLLAVIPNAIVGTEVRVTFNNAAAATHALTITDSASITNGGVAAHAAVAAATAKSIRIVFTNVTADSEAAVWYLD